MIISVNWLKKFTDIDVSIDELQQLIGTRLVEIEGVEHIGAKYKDVVVARVVECRPLENSDHLNVTKIDDGGVVAGVERDENGLVQVVCGAPNVTAGILVAWLPPNSVVPDTFGTKEPFTLGARELRGYMSNGMLASAQELALYEDHTGILVIDKDAAPGTSFAELYELDDYLLDIENKSLTHRPDAFGVIGFAREIAGIQGKQFTTPEWLQELNTTLIGDGSVQAPKVVIEDAELSDRYQAVVVSGVSQNAQSPIAIQTYLARSGVRPINAIVDVTNYLMLLTGQPMHAFDYDKFLAVDGSNDIRVRAARTGETLALLDGRTIELTEEDTVITSGDTPVSLAGAMGGAATEVDETTSRILLECATFNLYKMRALQMRHGVFTEAITRMTKGVPAPLSTPVLVEAVRMLQQFTGGVAVSEIAGDYPREAGHGVVSINATRVNDILGTQFAIEDMVLILNNVECRVDVDGLMLRVHVPYWRHDLALPEDIVEEIGRLTGFDLINPTMPLRDFTAVQPVSFDQVRAKLRQILVRSGANEVLTYSFVHGDVMKKAGQNTDQAYRIVNSISPDLQYYRQSILPSLLVNVQPNIKAGYDHFALFELNKFHTKLHDLTEEGVPKELDGLAYVVAHSKKQSSAAFYEAKRTLEYIAKSLGRTFVYEPLEADSTYPVTQPFEPLRSARVWDAETKERIGVVGELKKSVQKAFKLPEHVAGFEISPRGILKLVEQTGVSYDAISKYPTTERDICFQVADDVTYATVFDAATRAIEGEALSLTLAPLDIYKPAEGGAVKNITLRVTMGSYDRTLTGEDANAVMDKIINEVTTETQGKVV